MGVILIPLAVMFIIDVLIVTLSIKVKIKMKGNLLGIATSLIGWMPIVGAVMHAQTAAFIMDDIVEQAEVNQEVLEVNN